MKFELESLECTHAKVPQEIIDQYRAETNQQKRLDLAWEYYISGEHLYDEDIKAIIKEVDSAMKEVNEHY